MLKGSRQSKGFEYIAPIIKMGQIAPFIVFLLPIAV
jgi:hypothetical protein